MIRAISCAGGKPGPKFDRPPWLPLTFNDKLMVPTKLPKTLLFCTNISIVNGTELSFIIQMVGYQNGHTSAPKKIVWTLFYWSFWSSRVHVPAIDLWMFRLVYGRVHGPGKCTHSCTKQMYTHLYSLRYWLDQTYPGGPVLAGTGTIT